MHAPLSSSRVPARTPALMAREPDPLEARAFVRQPPFPEVLQFLPSMKHFVPRMLHEQVVPTLCTTLPRLADCLACLSPTFGVHILDPGHVDLAFLRYSFGLATYYSSHILL